MQGRAAVNRGHHPPCPVFSPASCCPALVACPRAKLPANSTLPVLHSRMCTLHSYSVLFNKEVRKEEEEDERMWLFRGGALG